MSGESFLLRVVRCWNRLRREDAPSLEVFKSRMDMTLGSQFQHLNTISVKILPLTSYLSLPSFSLKPFPLVLSLSPHA